LTTALEEISLLDLYDALGSPSLFAIATSEDTPTCLLERAANTAVDSALAAAEETFRATLEAVTVADLAADFEERLRELGLTSPMLFEHEHE
jgi:DNA-binding IscR family transcriptional regulator